MTDGSDAGFADAPMAYVCCAADRTYGGGAVPAGLEQDAPGALDVDATALGIESVAEVFGTARYHWRFSDCSFVSRSAFTDELERFYQATATQNCPAAVLVRLTDAVLAHSVLYASASMNPWIVYETHRPNDRPAVQLLNRASIRAADAKRFSDPGWRSIFVGSAGSSNYGHWLIDDLPRLKAVTAMMRYNDGPVRILIHSYGDPIDQVRIQSIRLLLGSSVHVDLLDPAVAYYFAELYYVTPVTYHPIQKSPIAIDEAARDVLARLAVEQHNRPTLLFVGRPAQYGRMITNQDEIEKLAKRNGFSIIDPFRMSFAEQVKSFAAAQVVIGHMGAAMTNTMFCRPTTTTIYLAPSGWIEPFYWDLSVVRGHHYRVLFGEVTDPTVPPHRSDFTLDPISLESAIMAL